MSFKFPVYAEHVFESTQKKKRLTVTIAVVVTMTVEVETEATVEVGVGMLRQWHALEMAEVATAVSQVGIGGLALRRRTSGTTSALTSTGPRRIPTGAVVAGGFPGSKITEVLPLVGIRSWVVEEHLGHSRRCPTGHNSGSG